MKILTPVRFLSSVFVAALTVVFIASCSNQSELANHIPKDANMVVAFDVKSMGLKSLDFKQILSFENIKKAFGNIGKSDTSANFLEKSGIDFLNKGYFFGKKTATAEYGAAIVPLSDAGKFEAFMKESWSDMEVTQEGDYKIGTAHSEKMAVGWNGSDAILLFGADNPKETMVFLTNLKKDESLAANSETFKELEKQAADISLWISFEEFQDLMSQYAAGTTTPMDLSETFLTATCNFEDGQVVIDSRYTTNDEMTKKFAFIKSNVSSSVAEILPGKSVIGMMGVALDMDKMYEYLESENLVEAYGAGSSQMTGLTVKEFFEMLTGDVALTVNDIAMKDVKGINWATGEEITRQEPEPNYCAVVGIANKERASGLLAKFAEQGMLTKNEDCYSFQDKLFVIEKDGALVITGTVETKQFAVDGNGEKLNSELKSLLSSNATSMYLNLNNIPEAVFNSSGDPRVGSSIRNSELEDVTFTGSTVKDNVSTGRIVIRFKQKNENSLVTITRVTKKFAEQWSAPALDPMSVDGEEVVSVP